MAKRPIFREGDRENGANSYGLANRAKSVKVIFSILLEKAFGNKVSVVFCNGAVGVAFNTKDPFATNGCLRCFGNELPSLVLEKGIKLKIHGFAPFQVFESLSMGGWFESRRERVKGGGIDEVGIKVF